MRQLHGTAPSSPPQLTTPRGNVNSEAGQGPVAGGGGGRRGDMYTATKSASHRGTEAHTEREHWRCCGGESGPVDSARLHNAYHAS